jgi:DNA-directed RNA polymerase specialized sigma24 family protein
VLFRSLSEIQCLVIVHCFHLELSHAEAAQVLGLPLGTLKSHLNRARSRLHELLGDWKPRSAI